ncbi:MAG: hypothetical protein JRJ21_11190 [Deltaproteobacteria bacterium]|nr:hypothetical protein [Deltaproteobacteria bacterium]
MDINSIKTLCEAGLPSSHEINRDKGFGEIFDRKIAELNATETLIPAGGKADVIEHGNKILNLLDDYAGELSNPRRTLKHIGPLVETIEKEAGLIEAEATEKVQNDSELERIIKDLTVTANVAAFKFNRGDYV